MEDLKELKRKYLDAVDSLKDDVIEMSDSFYREPETGLEEHRTSSAMQRMIRDSGYRVEPGTAGLSTAFTATFGSGAPGIALLAEMDALPGIGHGCGHNIAGSASVGAGSALSKVLGKGFAGRGTVLVLGTPAEEIGRGKIDMVKAGVFDPVDAAMMVHGSSKRAVVKQFLGVARYDLIFHGRASHAAAYPEEGVNALDAVIQTFNAVNALRQQLRSDVRVHGIITDGGRAPNIIPERAAASFYVRALELEELGRVQKRFLNCAHGAATATGCTLEVREVGDTNAPMKINPALAGAYRSALDFLGLSEDRYSPEKNLGSSDIGNVSQVVPTIHPHVPIRTGISIHTREFADATVTADGHRALVEGMQCLGLTVLELLFNPAVLQAVKRDFSGD